MQMYAYDDSEAKGVGGDSEGFQLLEIMAKFIAVLSNTLAFCLGCLLKCKLTESK